MRCVNISTFFYSLQYEESACDGGRVSESSEVLLRITRTIHDHEIIWGWDFIDDK
jgi:hypothetical protein